ncbi:MAG: hypothetical protein AAGJ35_14820, partial [Myxococcota bacterium]
CQRQLYQPPPHPRSINRPTWFDIDFALQALAQPRAHFSEVSNPLQPPRDLNPRSLQAVDGRRRQECAIILVYTHSRCMHTFMNLSFVQPRKPIPLFTNPQPNLVSQHQHHPNLLCNSVRRTLNVPPPHTTSLHSPRITYSPCTRRCMTSEHFLTPSNLVVRLLSFQRQQPTSLLGLRALLTLSNLVGWLFFFGSFSVQPRGTLFLRKMIKHLNRNNTKDTPTAKKAQ